MFITVSLVELFIPTVSVPAVTVSPVQSAASASSQIQCHSHTDTPSTVQEVPSRSLNNEASSSTTYQRPAIQLGQHRHTAYMPIRLYSTKSGVFNLKSYLDEVYALDDGGPTNNVYTLAFRHMKAKLPPTIDIINTVLRKYITVTQSELDGLIQLPMVQFDLPVPSTGPVRQH